MHGRVRFCLPPPGTKDLRQWLASADRVAICTAIDTSPLVIPRWVHQARCNVVENRRLRSEPSWAQRAAMLLGTIEDVERRVDLRERFEERAGIMEYEANLTRDQTECLAYEDLCRSAGYG